MHSRFFELNDKYIKDSMYKAIRDNPTHKSFKDKIEEIWNTFRLKCGDNAKDFKKRAANNLNHALWEMIIFNELKLRDKNIITIKAPAPDICVLEKGNKKIWLEATCKGEEKDIIKGQFGNPDKLLFDLMDSINKKNKKIKSYIDDNIISQDEIIILALNAGDQGQARLYNNFDENRFPIYEILYGIKSKKLSKCYFKKNHVTKHNNKKIEIGFF